MDKMNKEVFIKFIDNVSDKIKELHKMEVELHMKENLGKGITATFLKNVGDEFKAMVLTLAAIPVIKTRNNKIVNMKKVVFHDVEELVFIQFEFRGVEASSFYKVKELLTMFDCQNKEELIQLFKEQDIEVVVSKESKFGLSS